MESPLNKPIDYKSLLPKLKVKSLKVPANQTSKLVSILKDNVLSIKGIKPVAKFDASHNCILLGPDSDVSAVLELTGQTADQVCESEVQASAEHVGYQEILRRLLPTSVTVPSSFETIGSLALLNLRPAQLEFRFLIGKVILDTTKGLKTVVNKSDKLKNVFRTPTLDLLAGDPSYETEVIEEKVRLCLNVEQVYFCSRLHFERSRVLAEVKGKECVADVFCGIGPFAIRAAKEKQCRVFANDLNPECFKYLTLNAKKNKVDKLVTPFCMDGREFIHLVFEKLGKGEVCAINHFYMNLPALAIDFLDAFNTVSFKLLDIDFFLVHVYCFEEKEVTEHQIIEKVKARISKVLQPIWNQVSFANFNFVKNVSSKKAMLCVSLKISKQIGQAVPVPEKIGQHDPKQLKKIKDDNLMDN